MIHDLRYAFRLLRKSPGFTAVAVLSLALGIGANTAIFSLVNVVLLRPIPVQEPARLAAVFMTDQRNPGNLPLSHLNYKDLREQNQVFTDMAAFAFTQVNWSRGTASEQIPIQVVSGSFFSVLGAQPAIGRGLRPEEETAPTPVVVLSHGFWERSLGSDPAVIGSQLTLNRTPFTVVGVAPKGFTGTILGADPDGWVPMSMHDVVQPNFDWYEQRRGLFLFAFGRLKPGVGVEQAATNLRTVFAQLEQAYPTDNKGRSAGAVPFLDARLNPFGQGGAQVVQISLILMSVVGIVLLIACGNVANLLLARATRRRREIAVRLALGAERLRLVRQLLTESVVLSALGGTLGVLLAYWLLDALIAADLQLPLPVGDEVSVDARVLGFTALLALATGLLFGLAPAMQASKPDVVPVLKNELVPAATGRRGIAALLSLRQVLVVGQVALSLTSLVAAGLFLKSLQHAQGVDTGFETDSVLVMNVNLGREGYTPERGQLFYRQAVERIGGLPGVRHAAVAQNPPLAGGIARSVFPEGEETTTQDRILVQVNSVGPGYFEAIGIPLQRGRAFTEADAPAAPLVVVVNETMAERFWPGQDAIGKRFRFFGDDDFTTVVGVARNSKYNGVVEDPIPFIYQPMRQNYTPNATLHIRAQGSAAGLASAVRAQVLEIDPTLSVFNIRTLRQQVSQSLAPLRINVVVLTTFGVLALLLASIGLYGVASYSVVQRTREIGVRMALGADASNVLQLVLARGLILVGAGVAIGLALSILLASLIPADLLPNVSARDPWTFAGTAALLGAVALVANFIPARRAARIDPLVALRTE
ncbi:MAG TPA: ABC transporter permease [Vicinamibacterales bacterium]|nr:ABC transporter permease [Vicinamibacterales bacterium]